MNIKYRANLRDNGSGSKISRPYPLSDSETVTETDISGLDCLTVFLIFLSGLQSLNKK